METDNSGTVQATYTYGKDLIAMNRTDANSYYHYDGLGTARQLTNSSGSVTISYTYDSFGNLIASTGTSDNTYGFTGEQQFGEADGLVFLRARYYDSRVGRFISRDPRLSIEYYAVRGMDLQKFREWQKLVKPRWLNPYVYCLNNPVNLVDPTGGCEDVPPGLIGPLPAWIVEMGIVDSIGGLAGAACASQACASGLSSSEAFGFSLSICEDILKDAGPGGTPLFGFPPNTTAYWDECVVECDKLTSSDGYKDNCPCP